jgi:hypothetical protein
MADALVTKLSNIRQVIVIPTSSVRKYSNLSEDPIAAGNELKVKSILEGSLQRVGDRVRVNVRLVNVSNRMSLWAETFEEESEDIFALQDSISEKVADALAIRLSTPEKERITKRFTENSTAYQLYQKGRFFWNKRTEEGLEKGIEFFEQAIKEDPHFALAYAGIADSIWLQITNCARPPRYSPRPKKRHSRQSNSTIPSRNLVLRSESCRWIMTGLGAAEREFRHALSLNPNDGRPISGMP